MRNRERHGEGEIFLPMLPSHRISRPSCGRSSHKFRWLIDKWFF